MNQTRTNIFQKLYRFFLKSKYKNYSVDDKYNIQKNEKENELNNLLEKINKKGINSLNSKEKKKLQELSK